VIGLAPSAAWSAVRRLSKRPRRIRSIFRRQQFRYAAQFKIPQAALMTALDVGIRPGCADEDAARAE